MQKKKIEKALIDKVFLIGSFFYLISAINNPFLDINFSSMNNSITTLRGIAPYIMMPILIVYLIFINKNFKFEWIYFLFLIYLVGQFSGYLIIPLDLTYHLNDQDQIYWLVCNFTVFLYFYIIRDNKNFNILILKLFICTVSIIATKFIFDVYVEFFDNINNTGRIVNFFYNIHSMSPNRLFFEQPVPRSSGLSRMTVIIFLFLYIQLFFLKHEKNKTFYIIIISFLMLTILNLQNRVSNYYIIILFLFTFLFQISNLSFKKKIIYILFIFIIPLYIHLNLTQGTLVVTKIYKNLTSDNVKEIVEKDISEKKSNILKLEEKEEKQVSKILENLKKQRILIKSSTGRMDLWINAINWSHVNKFIGYGPQADRVLLKQNISSLYFYSILCGGIISLIAIILIFFILFFKSIKFIFIKKIFTSVELYTCYSLLCIGYLYLRSVVEISFGVFGIDMILFFLTFNILRNSEYY